MVKNPKAAYLSLQIFSVLFGVAAIITVIPYSGASEACVLGYRALCSFTPVSTIICIIAARTLYTLKTKFKAS